MVVHGRRCPGTDLRPGQRLAVDLSYDRLPDHRRPSDLGCGKRLERGRTEFGTRPTRRPPSAHGNLQTLTSYYNPNTTGNLTSGNTVLETFTYTVPFQAYQFDPGSTINQQVGQTFTQQLASGLKPEEFSPSDAHAITLPAGFVSGGASSGYVTEVGAVRPGYLTDTHVEGFTTTGYFGGEAKTFNDGSGTELDATSGVFYNYSTNEMNLMGLLAFPDSATSDTLTLNNEFGPAYVAWTAPTGGTITVNTSAWDPVGVSAPDGSPNFYVMTSTLGPANPILSATSFVAVGNNYEYGGIQSQTSTTVAGSSITDLGAARLLFGPGFELDQRPDFSQHGEVLYFVDDPGHYQINSHDNHSTGDWTDSLAVQTQISYTPEPSGIALLGLGAISLAAFARRHPGGGRRSLNPPGQVVQLSPLPSTRPTQE